MLCLEEAGNYARFSAEGGFQKFHNVHGCRQELFEIPSDYFQNGISNNIQYNKESTCYVFGKCSKDTFLDEFRDIDFC